MELPIGTFLTPSGKVYSGLWALPRPLTRHWGSGKLQERLEQIWGKCSVIFGKQDQVYGLSIDIDESTHPTVVADWAALPFADNTFKSGFWDPPYFGHIGRDGDVHYSRLESCRKEICRVLSCRLFILSPLIYPCMLGWKRVAVIAVTFGPNKIIRCLQGFEREEDN